MVNVVGIRFKKVGKIYYFEPQDLKINKGDYLIVETARGIELGECVIGIKEISEEEIISPLKKVLRIATEEDILKHKENKDKEVAALEICLKKIEEHNLNMKLIDVEYTFDNNKVLFYFTADGRVDFRELVKALASDFKVRIELRQIGQREGVKFLGAIGSCGMEVCCKRHLREFDLVTMKMAKDQGMTLSSNKIAGICGKLMCCIAYESKAYEELHKIVPGVGEQVKTPTCECCKVINADYLRQIVRTDNDGVVEEWEADKVKRLKQKVEKTDEANS